MRIFRTTLFWIHLLCGLTAGLVILVMSATGALLAMKPQIQNWIERDVRTITPRDAPRLSAGQLLAAVAAARPDVQPQTLTVDRDPGAAVTLSLGRDSSLYLDPYTGAVLGTNSQVTARFFQTLTSWHRYLGADGERRSVGRSFTGASNLMFLVLGVTGLFIWWPKQVTWRHLRPVIWFRRAGTGRGRDFNWHNTIGFWCVLPILVMTASGVVMSYSWANGLVYKLTGSPLPAPRGEAQGRTNAPRNRAEANAARASNGATDAVAPGTSALDHIDRLWSRAEEQVPTWSTLSMRVPGANDERVGFTITDGANWNRFARSTLTLTSDAAVAQWQPYEGNSLGQKVRGWLRFAHTGELGGVSAQLVAGIACLGGCFLVYTGIALALRRCWNWIRAGRVPRSTVGATGPAQSSATAFVQRPS